MSLCLMYHNFVESEADKELFEPAHRRYAMTRETFLAHLNIAAEVGWRFLRAEDLTDEERLADPKALLLTFDDSWREHEWTATTLYEKALSGIFFLNSGLIGQPGMLTAEAVGRMASHDQEIGSHSVTHGFLSSLDDEQLRSALMDSKRALQETCGRSVSFVSLPGGRLDRRISPAARAAGYVGVFTSRPGFLISPGRGFLLNRLPVTADITVERFRRMLQAPFPAVVTGRIIYGIASISRMMRR